MAQEWDLSALGIPPSQPGPAPPPEPDPLDWDLSALGIGQLPNFEPPTLNLYTERRDEVPFAPTVRERDEVLERRSAT